MITAAAAAIMYMSIDGPLSGFGAGEGEEGETEADDEGEADTEGETEAEGETDDEGDAEGEGFTLALGAAVTDTAVWDVELQYELLPAKVAWIL